MVIILIGASCSGKSKIQKELEEHFSFERIISATTRQPREGEVPDVDYYFITKEVFDGHVNQGHFAEYDEYSQGRKYGSFKEDYSNTDMNLVVVLTPNGFRSVIKRIDNPENVRSVYIDCPLGVRIKRYIDRVGEKQFTFDDKNEVAARVERDYGMFLGLEKEVDLVVSNDGSKSIREVTIDILEGLNIDTVWS